VPGLEHWQTLSAFPHGTGGVDLSNSRFQAAKNAQLTASQIPRLKLKWAFGFPDTKSVLG
jgi:hypothetical protein